MKAVGFTRDAAERDEADAYDPFDVALKDLRDAPSCAAAVP